MLPSKPPRLHSKGGRDRDQAAFEWLSVKILMRMLVSTDGWTLLFYSKELLIYKAGKKT